MRVLLISPLPPPSGGIATWTKRYLESKTALKNEIDVVNTAVVGNRVQNFTSKKVITEEVNRLFYFIKELKNKLKNKKYEVVHLNSACSKTGLFRDLIAAYMVKRNGIKLLVHFHCDVSYMLKLNRSRILFKKLVKLSDCILTLNTISHKYIFETCKKKSIIVSNFVSDDYITELTNKKIINKKAENFLFVGHITQTKGCDLICKLAEKFPNKKFILVGNVSDNIAKIIKTDNVILKGELMLQQVKQEYLSADVFLFPTHTEGFPVVVAEAMACGMPIITTPVGAIPDMIEDKGGIMLSVNDEESFVKAICEIESQKIREGMSAFNQSKVKDNYTVDKVIEILFDIYEKI